MRIVYLDQQVKSVTGGHKYNDAFLDYLQELSCENIIKTPSCAAIYPSWRKLIAPFAELKRLKQFKKGSLVFWGDTSYKYHFLLAIIAKITKRIHSSIIVHHFLYLGEKGPKRYITRVLQYMYISLFDDVIVPSPYTLDVAKNLFHRKKIFYIPLPFKKEFLKSENYEKGNLLYVGTIEERKGLKYLIDALDYILNSVEKIDFHLYIIGKVTEQSYYQEILNKIEEIGIKDNVTFLGRVSDKELKDCYNKAELFVFPSLLEGYGIVLVEAMSKGLPIIAFNNSAIPYSIKDGVNGLLAKNKDYHSYANKMMEVFGKTKYREQLQDGMKKAMDSIKTQEDFEKGIQDYFSFIKQESSHESNHIIMDK